MELTNKQQKIFDFVKMAHSGQVRKYTGEAYWHHLIAVAQTVKEHCPDDFGLVEIALCHDLLEDTDITDIRLASVLKDFGYTPEETLFITRGVLALTDVWDTKAYPQLNRSLRKKWEADRLGKIHSEYQTVKYADLIDNVISICRHDKKFAKVFLKEAYDIIAGMRMGNLGLLFKCYATLKTEERGLNSW